LSDAGVPVEKIARLVGHIATTTTETVYRHQIRPVVMGGAEVMDQLCPAGTAMLSYSFGYSVAKGHDSGSVVMASELVGVRGLEPRTSSLSGCRRFGSDSSFAALSWAYATNVRFSYLAMSCAYARGPRRSRAVVGPSLGPEPSDPWE
jgi:hypothetical protein